MIKLSNKARKELHARFQRASGDEVLRLLPLQFPGDPLLASLAELEDVLAAKLPQCVEAMREALDEDARDAFGEARQQFSEITGLGLSTAGIGRKIAGVLASSITLTKEPEEKITKGIEGLYERLGAYVRWLGARFFDDAWDETLGERAEALWPQLAARYPLGSPSANKGFFSHLARGPLQEVLLDIDRYRRAHETLRFRARYERTTLSTISAHLQDGTTSSVSARFLNGLQETEGWAVDFAIPQLRQIKEAFEADDELAFCQAVTRYEEALEGRHMDTLGLFFGAMEAIDGACEDAAISPARELLPPHMARYLRWIASRVFEESGWGESDFTTLGLRAAAAPFERISPEEVRGWCVPNALSPRWLLKSLDRRLAGHDALMRLLRRIAEKQLLNEAKALLQLLSG